MSNSNLEGQYSVFDWLKLQNANNSITKIGLIDVDNYKDIYHCFPNLPLMKISAYHKSLGHHVEWYDALAGGHYDKVYMSKVFSFTPDYPFDIDADEIFRGGADIALL